MLFNWANKNRFLSAITVCGHHRSLAKQPYNAASGEAEII